MDGMEDAMDNRILDTLPDLGKAELKTLFKTLFERPPPSRVGRAFLTINIAWEIQAKEHGRLSPRLRRKLETLARKFEKDPNFSPFDNKPNIKPGTRLVREWNGRPHAVTVTESGFEYEDEEYKSLSVIARTITGTRWSGPAFFGLKSPKRGAKP